MGSDEPGYATTGMGSLCANDELSFEKASAFQQSPFFQLKSPAGELCGVTVMGNHHDRLGEVPGGVAAGVS